MTLVLVPVLGLVTVVGTVVDQRRDDSVAAQAAAAQVRAAVLLDAVRGSVAQEVVPVLAQSVLSDPATASALGIDVSGIAALAGPAITQQLRSVQTATDAAVTATTGTPAATEATAAARTVAELRETATTGGDATATFDSYRLVVANLTGQVDAHLDAARDQSLDGPGARAVADLDRAQEAATYASLEVPLYLGSVSVNASTAAAARSTFLQA